MTIVDLEQFTPKDKPVIYTRVFVDLYNWKNSGQVYEIHGMIELEKMRALTVENLRNLDAHWIIEISSVLYSTHLVPKDQDKFVFYINNYINWDQYNQLYDLDWMEKGIKNADAVAHKLGLASTRVTNNKLEIFREERWKRKEMMERQKAEAMAAKQCRVRRRISLSSDEEDESDIEDNTDPNQADLDQANDKYLVEL